MTLKLYLTCWNFDNTTRRLKNLKTAKMFKSQVKVMKTRTFKAKKHHLKNRKDDPTLTLLEKIKPLTLLKLRCKVKKIR